MEEYDIYRDIRERTGGDVYIGVVGPVRAGKSTFISNFMQRTILPRMSDRKEAERVRDELPQSANGRAIMTTQPKFVPGEAVALQLGENINVRVRLVDCVGYLINGATGSVDEENKPRMVKTPWSDESMPFETAAETGTRKVIEDHSTVGIVAGYGLDTRNSIFNRKNQEKGTVQIPKILILTVYDKKRLRLYSL